MNSTILDRVKKLMSKAKSTDSIAEADALMSKATELLRAHNLEFSDVDQQENTIGEMDINGSRGWALSLYVSIAKPNMVSVVKCNKKGLRLVGKSSNIETVKFMFEFYKNAIEKLAEMSWQQQLGNNHIAKRSYKNDFMKGAVAGVGNKLAREFEIAKNTLPGTKDLIVSNDGLIKAYFNGRLKSSTHRTSVNNASAYYSGYDAAKGISTGAKQLTC